MTDPTIQPPSRPTIHPAVSPTATNPGRTLGIVAVVFAFVFSVLGLILGFVAKAQSTAAGHRNAPAQAAIVISIVLIVLWTGAVIAALVWASTNPMAPCALGESTMQDVNGEVVACG